MSVRPAHENLVGKVRGAWGLATVAALALCAFAATALASASPISPAPGSVVTTSHPVFAWTLPPDEDAYEIQVATKPDTASDGKFFDENTADFDFLRPGDRRWVSTQPLAAGHYWWDVASISAATEDPSQVRWSTPVDFTIPPAARITGVSVARHAGLRSLTVSVRWVANVEQVTLSARFSKSGRVIRSTVERELDLVEKPASDSVDLYLPRTVKRRTRLVLSVAVGAQGARATVSRAVIAP